MIVGINTAWTYTEPFTLKIQWSTLFAYYCYLPTTEKKTQKNLYLFFDVQINRADFLYKQLYNTQLGLTFQEIEK